MAANARRLFDEGVRDVDIFGHHDPARHVLAVLKLIGAGAQHGAQDRVDPLQRPSLLQGIVDQGVELGLVAHHAGDDVAEKCGFRRERVLRQSVVKDGQLIDQALDIRTV